MKSITTFRDLDSYKLAFELQQSVFKASRAWPKEEAYSLTDQIRRSSRSIGANLAEAWGKRKYPAHFLSKLTDADGELQETFHWVTTAGACGYINESDSKVLLSGYEAFGAKLGSMIAKYDKFCVY